MPFIVNFTLLFSFLFNFQIEKNRQEVKKLNYGLKWLFEKHPKTLAANSKIIIPNFKEIGPQWAAAVRTSIFFFFFFVFTYCMYKNNYIL